MPEKDLSTVLVALARIEERQEAAQKAGEHRHENLRLTVEKLASQKDLQAVEKRVSSIESNQTWVVRSMLTAIVSATIGASILVRKTLLA
jgi:hypothetical protein